MSKYRIQIFEPGLLDHVARLQQQLRGGSRSDNRAYLTWKYLENPYLTDPLLYIARHRDRVVGMRGMYGTSWLVPGLDHPQVLPCAADTGISPDHRDSGLFADLTDFALADLNNRGFPYVINMSATPANYVTSIMTMGWRKVGSYEPLIRSTTPISVATPERPKLGAISAMKRLSTGLNSKRVRAAVRSARRLRRKAFGRNPFSEFDQHLRPVGADSVEIALRPRQDAMERIASQFDPRTAIRHLRDETYFAWRYANPHATYRFLFLGADDSQGYAVLQGTSGSPAIQLVDWAGEAESFAELLDATISLSKPAQLGTWGATAPPAIRQHLGRAGFVPDRIDSRARRGGLIVRSLSAGEIDDWSIGTRPLLDLDNWDLRMILSDRY